MVLEQVGVKLPVVSDGGGGSGSSSLSGAVSAADAAAEYDAPRRGSTSPPPPERPASQLRERWSGTSWWDSAAVSSAACSPRGGAASASSPPLRAPLSPTRPHSYTHGSHTEEHTPDSALLKLGGVGGVTRSGSWGKSGGAAQAHAQYASSRGRASPLEPSAESSVADEDEDGTAAAASAAAAHRRSSSFDVMSSRSTDVPSSSSRTSTSSYSAAAFSLRSFSNRNSASSTASSSAASSSRSGAAMHEADLGRRSSLAYLCEDGSAGSSTAVDVTPAASSAASSSSEAASSSSSARAGSSGSGGTANGASSVAGPSVSRVQSIGRGNRSSVPEAEEEREAEEYSERMRSPTAAARARSAHAEMEQRSADSSGPGVNRIRSIGRGAPPAPIDSPAVSPRASPPASPPPPPSRSLRPASPQRTPQQPTSAALGTSPRKLPAAAFLQTPSSPHAAPSRRSASGSSSRSLAVASSSAAAGPSSWGSPSLPSLAAAAAAAPPAASASSGTDATPLPRRHSGAFALRTRSMLSQHAGLHMTFGAGGAGRAAARAIERQRDESVPLANAPFSQLEAAQRQGSSSRSSSSEAQPRPVLPINPALAPPGFLPPGPLSPMALASPDAHAWLVPRDDAPELSLEDRASDPGGAEGAAAVGAPFRTRARALPPLDVSSADVGLGLVSPSLRSAAAVAAPRPGLSRSSTGIGALLRTPTTEEWSRYLASQGSAPTSFSELPRSRTATARSSASALARRAELLMTTGSADVRALSGAGDSDGEGDSDEDGDSPLDPAEAAQAQGMMERLRSLSMGRTASSRTGSIAGGDADLHSVHEDDEEDEAGMSDGSAEWDARSDSSGYSASSSNERMRALHEALSRPPSPSWRAPSAAPASPGGSAVPGSSPRTRTPDLPRSPPSGRVAEVREGSSGAGIGALASAAHESTPTRSTTLRARRPTRETAATHLGYPLPPAGERRSIADFVVIADIGRGAYGLVKKVRLRGADGLPVGDDYCIKYIIKSRILADCWRRHKTLGPIPVEIHVMDQLRRLPYHPPATPPPWAPERLIPGTPGANAEQPAGLAAPFVPESQSGAPLGVSHPSLCTMIDFFEDHEFYYLVMPCLSGTRTGHGAGQDLFDFVESAPDGLSTAEVRTIFGQVADGVRFLHANSIVHRDLKDENVILDFRHGRPHAQIIDFGSAAHVRAGRLFDTFSGTLDYAAAEILRGEQYGGCEQDVWALGVVGYVLLCGDCPFWNGDEAVEGLAPGSRAATALRERCMLGEARPGEEPAPPGAEPPKSIMADDGGGRLHDAADLIAQCLQLEPGMRPTAQQVCEHRFLVGAHGWHGARGWERETPPTPLAQQEAGET